MKRPGNLHRTGHLKRGSAPQRTVALARVSPKRKAEEDRRKDVILAVWTRDRFCVAAPDGPRPVGAVACGGPLDVDEIVGRGRGGDYLDPDNCQLLCRRHHDWKHAHPEAATAVGLSCSLPPPEPPALPPT